MRLLALATLLLSPLTSYAALMPNLLPGASSWSDLVKGIAERIVPIGTSLVVIMVIYSGFLFVKSQGNEKDLPKAKGALWWAIVGGVLLIGATAIAMGLLDVIKGL